MSRNLRSKAPTILALSRWSSLLPVLPRQEAWIPLHAMEPGALEEEETKEPFTGGCEAELTVEGISSLLTVIVSTSPSKGHCNLELLMGVLLSIQRCPALHPCRKLLVFDAHAESLEEVADSGRAWVADGTAQLRSEYRQYVSAVQEAAANCHPALHAVELLIMPDWGHLVGTVRHALGSVSTPLVMLHQHDLILSPMLTEAKLLASLRLLLARRANCVLLNRDVNFARRSAQYLLSPFRLPSQWRVFQRQHGIETEVGAFSPFVGYSDQSQFARVDWLQENVLRPVGWRKCCMEFVVHELMIRRWLHKPCVWQKTYMLGSMEDGPFIFDSQKNGNAWAREDLAYSEEHMEEVYVASAARLRSRGDEKLCLALYIYERRLMPAALFPTVVVTAQQCRSIADHVASAVFSAARCRHHTLKCSAAV